MPNETSASLERKRRRHTGSEQQRRTSPHYTGRRPAGITAQGSSLAHPIDLTSPPRQRPQMPQPRVSGGSSESFQARSNAIGMVSEASSEDVVLPRWQSDAEVTKCPVCRTEFSFWYRKHHCRKCGRVVCAACSPHRITIPRQYIVQAPANTVLENEQQAGPTSPAGRELGRNLGGGEIVRVCNPCVPDPWTPGTAESPARALPEQPRRRESADESRRPDRYRYIPAPPPRQSSHEGGRARSQSHQPAASALSRSVPHSSGFLLRNDPRNRRPPLPPPPPGPSGHRYSQSSSDATPAALPSFTSARPSAVPSHSTPPQPKPRREVREEDECPVCGTELPPGPNLREAHIQECIAARFSSGAPSSYHQAPAPTHSYSTNDASGPSTPPAQRPRARSYRPRGMALYRATEKDCTNEDDEPQECVICFEEFQPGDEMGRMECLCKFHRSCIRQWWDTKGVGSCPTHMLHE